MSAHVNMPTPIVWARYIAIDLHKHFLMVGGINAQLVGDWGCHTLWGCPATGRLCGTGGRGSLQRQNPSDGADH
jgi:hypothetical protein